MTRNDGAEGAVSLIRDSGSVREGETPMFVAINRLKMPAEYGEHLEKAFQMNAMGMVGVAGFISFDLLRNEEPGEFLVVTRWDDKPSFEAWREGDMFSRAHGNVNPNSPVRSELATYEVVISKP